MKSSPRNKVQPKQQKPDFMGNSPYLCDPQNQHPDVVKLVDTSDLGSDAARCGGSSPSIRTTDKFFYGHHYARIHC